MELNKLFKGMMAGAMALSLAACGGGNDSTSSTAGGAEGGEGEVSVFYYTFGDDYISTVRAALDANLKEAGVVFNDYDGGNNQTTQTEQIQTAISKGSKMLVVNVVDTASKDAAKNIIEMAEAAGIPVIFFNRSVDEDVITAYDKAAFVGTDYEMAGKMQGDMVGDYLNANFEAVDLNGDGEISYMMLKGQEGNAEADARTQYGVENANAKLEAEGHKPLAYYKADAPTKYELDKDGAWSSAQGTDIMQNALSQYNEDNGDMIECVIANNDGMALGAMSALQNAGYNTGEEGSKVIPIFGVDALDDAKKAIDEGKMTGTIKQDGEGMAKAICTMVQNMTSDKDKFDSLDAANVIGTWRINIPYSEYKAS
ncbi:galactose ABC transporter substrate-binding protein [Allobaculum stercoricanis]|uniref:galactose ABC transporter substrate-binding protein n=1 Tax=Allobaculum stercoricanis TaxID=174709 RepID=UPI0003680843|nr:galactose ABC transporter substrate-binding protein [Allobaculum stercoricanis]